MQTVTATFKIASKTEHSFYNEGKSSFSIKGFPVVDEQNKEVFEATPVGSLELGGLKEEVSSFFRPGKDYLITISEAN